MKQNTTPIITVEIPDCGDSLTTAQSVYLTVSNSKASYDILADKKNIHAEIKPKHSNNYNSQISISIEICKMIHIERI